MQAEHPRGYPLPHDLLLSLRLKAEGVVTARSSASAIATVLTKRNAFVGRDQIACQTEAGQRESLWRKIDPSFPEGIAVVEQSGIEKVRRKSPCFGFEFTEAQHIAADGKLR